MPMIKTNQKGSALLSILAALALLTIIIFLILNYSVNERRYSQMRTSLDTSLWNARGAFLLLSQRLQGLEIRSGSHAEKGAIEDLDAAYMIQKRSDSTIQIEIEPISLGPKQRIVREMENHDYTDFIFVYNGDFMISVAKGETKEISGRIHVDGKVILDIDGKLIWDAETSGPLLECQQVQIMSNGTGEITLKKRHRFNNESAIFFTKKTPSDLSSFVKLDNSQLVYPDIQRVAALLADPAKAEHPDPRLINKTKMINAALPEKEELHQLNGFEPRWEIQRTDIAKIYFFPPVVRGIVNPDNALDTDGYSPGFEIKEGILSLKSSSLKLNLRPEDCSVLNQFHYGLPGNIAASLYREIISVSLGDRKLEEGRDIEIDREVRKIIFYDPPFRKTISRGTGERETFMTPPDFNPKNPVFVGTRRVDHFKYDHGQITFPFTPPNHEEISYYTEIPELYITKGRPFPSSKAYIDKEVEVLEIDLSDKRWTSGSILVFDGPIHLKGEPRTKITIICEDDTYLENIGSGKGLEIYCRSVWSIKDEPIKLNNVFLYSTGSRILSITGKPIQISMQGTLVLNGASGINANKEKKEIASGQLIQLNESAIVKNLQTLPIILRK